MWVRDHVPQYYRWLKFRTIGRTVSSFIYTTSQRDLHTEIYDIATNYSRLQPVKVHHGVQLLGVAAIPAKGWAFSSHLGSLVSAADLQTPSPEAPVKMVVSRFHGCSGRVCTWARSDPASKSYTATMPIIPCSWILHFSNLPACRENYLHTLCACVQHSCACIPAPLTACFDGVSTYKRMEGSPRQKKK